MHPNADADPAPGHSARRRTILASGCALAMALCLVGPTKVVAQEPQCIPVGDPATWQPAASLSMGCSILARKELGTLPEAEVYWHIDTYPTFQDAFESLGSRSTIVRLNNRILVFSIEKEGWRPASPAQRLHQVGPLPIEPDKSYTAVFTESSTLAGQSSSTAAFGGPVAWLPLQGGMCIETQSGRMVLNPSESGVLRKPGTSLRIVTGADASIARRWGVALHETSKPLVLDDSNWKPAGECKGGYAKIDFAFKNDLGGDQPFATWLALVRRVAAKETLASFSEVLGRRFFWDGADDLDPKAAPLVNFGRALGVASESQRKPRGAGRQWRRLQAILSQNSWTWAEGRPGVVCGPADPAYDRSKLQAVTGAEDDWAYATSPVEVRQGPAHDARVIGSISNLLVRVLQFPTQVTGRAKFFHVMLPDGQVGYVHGEHELWRLKGDQLCFGKEQGKWRITGYISRE